MSEASWAALALAIMVGCFWAGFIVQRSLHETHRSRDSVDSIRVVITLLVTFADVVLGLLISTTQARFVGIEVGLRALSADISELDERLRTYGGAANPIRAALIEYTRAAIADTWRDEPPPPGVYPRNLTRMSEGSVESVELSTLLAQTDLAIRSLVPASDVQRSLIRQIEARMTALLDQRLTLIESARPSISWPFMAILMFWLAAIFAIAGLSSSRNVVVFASTVLAALSVASSIYLALDLDTPLTGVITVSSAPMRDALTHILLPPLPAGVN